MQYWQSQLKHRIAKDGETSAGWNMLRNCHRKVKTNDVSQTLARSSVAQRSDASHRFGTLSASSKCLSLTASARRLVARSPNQNDAASSSQVRQTTAKTTSAGRIAVWGAKDADLSASTRKRVEGGLNIVDMSFEWQNDHEILP